MNTLIQLAQTYTTYTYSSSEQEAAGFVLLALMLPIFIFFMLVSYVVVSFLLSRIFKKAGQEPWKAWVPIYNSWVLLGLGGQSGIWAILAFVPLVNIVSVIFLFIAIHHVGLKLQKEGWFVLLAIFVPLVWLVWLAFDKSTWQTAEGAPATPPLPGAQPATPAPAPITPAPEPVETASESATAETEPATVAEQPVEEPAPVVTPEPVNEPVADTETSPTVEQPTEEPEPATEPASSSDEEPKPPVA